MFKRFLLNLRINLASFILGDIKFIKNVNINIWSKKIVPFKDLQHCTIINTKVYYKNMTTSVIKDCSYCNIIGLTGFEIKDSLTFKF